MQDLFSRGVFEKHMRGSISWKRLKPTHAEVGIAEVRLIAECLGWGWGSRAWTLEAKYFDPKLQQVTDEGTQSPLPLCVFFWREPGLAFLMSHAAIGL